MKLNVSFELPFAITPEKLPVPLLLPTESVRVEDTVFILATTTPVPLSASIGRVTPELVPGDAQPILEAISPNSIVPLIVSVAFGRLETPVTAKPLPAPAVTLALPATVNVPL